MVITRIIEVITRKLPTSKNSKDVQRLVNTLREQIESGVLVVNLRGESVVARTAATEKPLAKTEAKHVLLETEAATREGVFTETSGVMKRCPSLTWREANERARILFYKDQVPMIHYNEKRDSFRVSMLKTDDGVSGSGEKRLTREVPVFDEDVRRLLNSCGLYWNGESISLLNKSDEIFGDAQKEAFDILNAMRIQ